jgi:hypothetical protein
MYAAKDGNVYKKTDSGWQSYNNGSWNPANASAQQARTSGGSSGELSTKSANSRNESGVSKPARGAAQSQQFKAFSVLAWGTGTFWWRRRATALSSGSRKMEVDVNNSGINQKHLLASKHFQRLGIA